jgi:hypothetical protein
MMAEIHDLAAYRAETDRLVEKHLDQLGFGRADMIRRQKETEEAQLARWGDHPLRDPDSGKQVTLRQLYERRGYIGLAILDVIDEAEEREHRSQWAAEDAEDDAVLARIAAL